MADRMPLRRLVARSGKRILAACTKGFAASGVRVLGYHSISQGDSPLCVSPVDFEAQLRFLRDNGFVALSIADYARRIRERRAGRKKEVLITFDDGYVDFIERAAPLLKRYECRATVFVAPQFVGAGPAWLGRDHERILQLLQSIHFRPSDYEQVLRWNEEFAAARLMNWDQLRQLRQDGFDVQSHSAAHHFLTDLPDEQLEDDLASSRRQLEQELGDPMLAIAYPYGDCDARVARAAEKAGYRIGFRSLPRPHVPPFQIARTQIGGPDMRHSFRYCLSLASTCEEAMRGTLNRIRGRR